MGDRKQIRRVIAGGLTVLLALLISGCNGRKKSASDSPGDSAPASKETNGQKLSVNAIEAELCQRFSQAIDDAITLHISRKQTERTQLMAEGYKKFLEGLRKNKELLLSEETVAQLETAAGSEIATCEPYLLAAQALKKQF
jgi:hypothetical protein